MLPLDIRDGNHADDIDDLQEDVLQLVELSQDIRRDRHERIREIQWEREHLPERPARRPAIEEERVVEREVIYEGRRPPPRFLRGP